MVTGRTEPGLATLTVWQFLNRHELDGGDRHDEKLGDSISSVHDVSLRRIRIQQRNLDLAPIARIDNTRRIHDRDAVLRCKAGTRSHQTHRALGQRNCRPGSHQRPLPRRKRHRLAGVEIRASIARVRVGWGLTSKGNLKRCSHSERLADFALDTYPREDSGTSSTEVMK